MNTKAKGEKAQIIVMGELAKWDIPLLIPLSDNLPFDFVLMVNGQMKKIQVKSSEACNSSGAREFNLKMSNWNKGTSRSYCETDCDFIICYNYQDGSMYLLEPDNFVGAKSFAIRKDKTRNGQTKGLNMHDDFLLTKERLLERIKP